MAALEAKDAMFDAVLCELFGFGDWALTHLAESCTTLLVRFLLEWKDIQKDGLFS